MLDEIRFEVLDDDTDHPVVTARIVIGNREIMAMADVSESKDAAELRLRGLHMHGDGPLTLGVSRLRAVADKVMEVMGYDAIVVEGAHRTTGAAPGHRPRRLRFTSRDRDPVQGE